VNDRCDVIIRLLDGTLSETELSALMLDSTEDPELVDALVQAVIIDDLLSRHVEFLRDTAHASCLASFREGFAPTGPNNGTAPACDRLAHERNSEAAPRSAPSRSRLRFWQLAATACVGVALICVWLFSGLFRRQPDTVATIATNPSVAQFSRSVNVEWPNGAHRWAVGDRVSIGQRVELSSGRAELVFNSGAVLALAGPAVLVLESEDSVRLHSGTATTRVEGAEAPHEGKFRVLTPATEVVDLGTEFGVRVAPGGETDVVVFDGSVDFTPLAVSEAVPAPRRLAIGEAARISADGDWQRLVSIDNDAFPFGERIFAQSTRRPPLIIGVRDDLRSPASPKYYRICHEGLGEDARAYVDRVHEWNGTAEEGLPYFLQGADYVATFNDDKRQSPTITVELSQPAILYVFYDDRMVVPDWLSESFEDTGLNIGLDEGPSPVMHSFRVDVGPGTSIDTVHSIWRRRIDQAGPVRLGSIGERRSGWSMYGIAAQPL
jgi:ferric-dicitrate binding protein FerR (iron transport regulator)